MTRRRPVLPCLAAILALLAAGDVAAQRRIDERAAFQGGGIRIYNMVGTVRVLGWAHDSIAVSGTVHEGGEPFLMHVAAEGAKVGIWNPKATNLPPSDLEVRVPAGSQVWVKTGSAGITVGGLTGGVDLVSVTGGIQVTGSPRELAAETMGGSIAAAVTTRRARLKTAAGAIALRGTIDDVDATSVSGAIEIAGGSIRLGRFESIEGRIVHAGGFDPDAALEFTTHSGTIEFALPASASAAFMVRTFEGSLDDRLGVTVSKTARPTGRELVFDVGEGDAVISVNSFRGTVVLRR